jgi:hypothetical protein
MVPERRGRRLKAPSPAGNAFTTPELRRGTPDRASIRLPAAHRYECMEDTVSTRFDMGTAVEEGWNHDEKLVPLGYGFFYFH